MMSNVRLLSLAAVLAVFSFVVHPAANAQIPTGKVGVGVGGNFETLSDVQSGNTNASFSNPVGFHFGLSYDQPLGATGLLNAISVRPGLYLRQVGQYGFPESLSGRGAALLSNEDFQLRRYEIPLDFRYRVLELDLVPGTTPYVLVGPQASLARAENDFEAALKNASYSINAGIGAEIDLAADLVLMPEFRYEYGLTDAFKDEFTYRFREFTIENPPNFGGPSLRVLLYYDL